MTRAPLGKVTNIVAVGFKNTLKNFKLLSFAQHLLIEQDIRNTQGGRHRTRQCHAARAYQADTITLNIPESEHFEYASLGGVQTCGSVWSCPVCAQRIAVQRAKEIRKALSWAEAEGYIPVMVTLTAQHTANMRLEGFKNQFKQSWRGFTQSRRWRKLKAALQVEHTIKAIEITKGQNGWHYHSHGLLFVPKQALAALEGEQFEQWVSEARRHWLHCLASQGLSGIGEYAFDVRAAPDIGELYLSKLGLQESDTADVRHELSGASNKHGRGATVWTLLRRASEGDDRAASDYVEYVSAMQGDNWITWSHGFKALVGADDISDVELSDEDSPPELELVPWLALDDESYAHVRYAKAYGELLEIAATTRDKQAVFEFIERCAQQWQTRPTDSVGALRQQYSRVMQCARYAQRALNRQPNEFGQQRLQKHLADAQRLEARLLAYGIEVSAR